MTALTEARWTAAGCVPFYTAAVVSLAWGGQGRYAAFYALLGCFLLLVGLRQSKKARDRIEERRTWARRQRRRYLNDPR